MKRLLLVGLAAVALTAAVPAHAQISLTGECGLMRTMNTSALPPMTLVVAADYVGSDDTFLPIRAEFGVIEGLEVGVSYWYLNTAGIDSAIGVNTKYRLPLQLVEGLSLAVGANYQSMSGDLDVKELKLTGVASYDYKVGETGVTPSAGLIIDWQDADETNTGLRLFGNVVVMVLPNLGIGGEFVTKVSSLDGENADPSFWFGARFMPSEELSVQAGLINNADFGGSDRSSYVFHVGASYAFSFAR